LDAVTNLMVEYINLNKGFFKKFFFSTPCASQAHLGQNLGDLSVPDVNIHYFTFLRASHAGLALLEGPALGEPGKVLPTVLSFTQRGPDSKHQGLVPSTSNGGEVQVHSMLKLGGLACRQPTGDRA
jgi:hypothetical protein